LDQTLDLQALLVLKQVQQLVDVTDKQAGQVLPQVSVCM
jgi:hypothetical protein